MNYTVEKVHLVLTNSFLDLLADKSFNRVINVIRYARDDFSSSGMRRTRKKESYWNKIMIQLLPRHNDYMERLDKSIKCFNENKGEVARSPIKDILFSKTQPADNRYNRKKILWVMKKLGFKFEHMPYGIKVFGWNIPKLFRDDSRFFTVFHYLTLELFKVNEAHALESHLLYRNSNGDLFDIQFYRLNEDLYYSYPNINDDFKNLMLKVTDITGKYSECTMSGILSQANKKHPEEGDGIQWGTYVLDGHSIILNSKK